MQGLVNLPAVTIKLADALGLGPLDPQTQGTQAARRPIRIRAPKRKMTTYSIPEVMDLEDKSWRLAGLFAIDGCNGTSYGSIDSFMLPMTPADMLALQETKLDLTQRGSERKLLKGMAGTVPLPLLTSVLRVGFLLVSWLSLELILGRDRCRWNWSMTRSDPESLSHGSALPSRVGFS